MAYLLVMSHLRWDLTVRDTTAGDLQALLAELDGSLPVVLEKIRISIDPTGIGDIQAMQRLTNALRRHGITWDDPKAG